MSDEAKEIAVAPTDVEIELTDWARQAWRDSIGTVNASLKQMVTLNTALLGGSAALLGHLESAKSCKAISVTLLLASLVASLLGAFPFTANIEIRNPEEVRGARAVGERYKLNCLKVASFCMALAFAMLMLGILTFVSVEP